MVSLFQFERETSAFSSIASKRLLIVHLCLNMEVQFGWGEAIDGNQWRIQASITEDYPKLEKHQQTARVASEGHQMAAAVHVFR